MNRPWLFSTVAGGRKDSTEEKKARHNKCGAYGLMVTTSSLIVLPSQNATSVVGTISCGKRTR
jgi:hypothetical protein